MSLFSLFARPDIEHAQFGQLRWRHGVWIGIVDDLEVRMHGNKLGPHQADAALLKNAIDSLQTLKSLAAPLVFDHYSGYKEADDSGLILGTDEPLPDIRDPKAVWEHTTQHVLRVGPYSDSNQIELCFMAAWDIEHTLGALFENTKLIELSGSIALPRI